MPDMTEKKPDRIRRHEPATYTNRIETIRTPDGIEVRLDGDLLGVAQNGPEARDLIANAALAKAAL